MTDVVFFTNGYPYKENEKPFVYPELCTLVKRFNVKLVAIIDDQTTEHFKADSVLDMCEVMPYRMPSTCGLHAVRYLPYVLSALLSPLFYRELFDLITDGFTLGRLLDSAKQFAQAKHFLSFCRGNNLFSSRENTIYYSFWFATASLALTLEKAASADLNIVCRAHGYDLYNERSLYSRQPFQRMKRDACDRLCFISKTGKLYFEKAFGPESFPGQYEVNYLGSSRQMRECSRLKGDGAFTIVSCSNVIPLKRIDMIAEAVNHFSKGRLKWIHFGDGSQLHQIKDYCLEHDLAAQFPGMVDNDKILEYYKSHSIGAFITLSSSEGLPVSVIEAESCGLPVIATDVGGIWEAMDGNGILLDSNPNVDDVVSALEIILQLNQTEWQELSWRSFNIWSTKFNSENTKRDLLRIFDSVRCS